MGRYDYSSVEETLAMPEKSIEAPVVQAARVYADACATLARLQQEHRKLSEELKRAINIREETKAQLVTAIQATEEER